MSLENLILNENVYPYKTTFYNPKVSCLILDISLDGPKLQLAISPTLNPDADPRQMKGQKAYDHDKKVNFSINPLECSEIFSSAKSILNGTYTNPNPKTDEKYKSTFSLIHKRDNGTFTRLSLSATRNNNGGITGSISVGIGDGKNTIWYHLRPSEMKIFLKFIEHSAYDLPFHTCLIGSIVKLFKMRNFDQTDGDKTKGQKLQSNNYSKPSSQPTQEEETISSSEELENPFDGDDTPWM